MQVHFVLKELVRKSIGETEVSSGNKSCDGLFHLKI